MITTLNQSRFAVSAYFFFNGFMFANWSSRLPELQRFFGVSNTELGTLLLVIALGAIIAMPFTGALVQRYGTKSWTKIVGLIYVMTIPFLAISPSLYVAFPIFFCIGLLNGSMDVSMNGQAVFVERLFQKPILSSFHALFSIGMALGAGAGALFAYFDVSLLVHFGSMAILAFCVLWYTAKFMVEDPPEEKEESEGPKFRLPTKAILPLGIIAFCGMTGEGSMTDWSAIFMNTVVGQSEAFSAFAFGVYAATMTIGRLLGDSLTQKWGSDRLLIFDGVLAITGLSVVILFPSAIPTIIGYAMIGLGISTIVPIIYSRAGNTKGVNPSVGIAMATTIGY
ncbi:MAG: MFS transporter, partial [Bacteroidota bacterium]